MAEKVQPLIWAFQTGVSGSKAVCEKQIDVNGKTVQFTKTTYDSKGNIVHVKDKRNGGTYQ